MKKLIKTNRGVSAFIYRQGKFLILKGASSDYWMLPGGRVYQDEFLLPALRREVKEETGLKKIKVLAPISYWQGRHDHGRREGVAFLCLYQGGQIKLSFEHTDFRWITPKETKKFKLTHDYRLFYQAEKLIKSHILRKL